MRRLPHGKWQLFGWCCHLLWQRSDDYKSKYAHCAAIKSIELIEEKSKTQTPQKKRQREGERSVKRNSRKVKMKAWAKQDNTAGRRTQHVASCGRRRRPSTAA